MFNERNLVVHSMLYYQTNIGASIRNGTGGHVPILMKGDVHGNVPQYFRSDVV